MNNTDARNKGHGHVTPRPDGYRSRCGGPAICAVCQRERAGFEAATQPPQDERRQGLSAFDAAVSAELPCVSTAEFNSHEICKWFAANVRMRILEARQDMSKESFEAMLLDDSDSPELLEKRKSDALETDAQRYRHLRGCRGMEHDPLFSVRDEEGNVLWGGDLDHEVDESIMYARDIYGDLPAAVPNIAEPAQPVALSTLTDERIDEWTQTIAKYHVWGYQITGMQQIREFARAIERDVLAASAPAQQATPPQPVAADVVNFADLMGKLPRFRYGYSSDEWGMNRTLGYIADPDGPIVRYADIVSAFVPKQKDSHD